MAQQKLTNFRPASYKAQTNSAALKMGYTFQNKSFDIHVAICIQQLTFSP